MKKNNNRTGKSSGPRVAKKPKSTQVQRPKQNETGVIPYIKTPAFNNLCKFQTAMFGAPPKGTADIKMGGDPYLGKSKTQMVHKVDASIMSIQYAETMKLSLYNDSTAQAAGTGDKKAKRVNWLVPFNYQQPGTGPAYSDSRGTFADIGRTEIHFANQCKQEIRVIINSPRGRIDDKTGPYLRKNKVERILKPGKKFVYTSNYGDRSNIFTPMVEYIPNQKVATGKEFYPSFGVADFLIVTPDVDEMSGTAPDKEVICDVVVKQHYWVTTVYPNNTLLTVDPIAIQGLSSLADMFFEKNVIIPESGITVADLTGNNKRMSLQKTNYKKDQAYRLCFLDKNRVELFLDEGDMVCNNKDDTVYKQQDGNLICWDEDLDMPAYDVDLTRVYPPHTKWERVSQIKEVNFDNLIGFLTAMTEIVRALMVLL